MTKKLHCLVLLNFFLLACIIKPAEAQDKFVSHLWDASYEMQDRNIELSHLDALLIIKPYDTLVAGKADFTFKTLTENTDSIVFSVPELNISKININGQNCGFRIRGSEVSIYPPAKLSWLSINSITFEYTAKPTDGLYFVGWNDPKQLKRKQIWAHRPDHWLPYIAGIITVDMAITVDERYKVFNNGVREKVTENSDHTKTWFYKMGHPHPFFSTCLVIGDYDYSAMQTKRGLPLELWYYPDWKNHLEPTFRYMPEMFEYFESEFGVNYPWEVYKEAPVIDYMYGAMETTTSTIFGDYLMVDARGFKGRNYINVNAHELAHQWFGNYLSHLKNQDVWLTESFATYWAKKFEQHIFGPDYYQDVRNKELAETFEAATHDNFSVGHSSGGRVRWYPKGSLVLDMLRDVLGENEFKASIKLYLEGNPYQVVETSDFLAAIRKATGQSLEWFFEEWIYRGGEPSYDLNYLQVTNAGNVAETRVSVDQVQKTDDLIGLFKMPVYVEVHYKDGTSDSKKQWISQRHEEVTIPNKSTKLIDFVIFDPGRKIIKKVKFTRSFDELSAQAMLAANMIDRYDALLALRDFPLVQKKTFLAKCYEHETFQLTKGEIIAQLSADSSMATHELLDKAINDPDDKVRLAVLQNVTKVPLSLRQHYERLLTDSSYLNVELALTNLCSSFPDHTKNYLDLTKNEVGWRGKNIRMKWLEIAINNGNHQYYDELKSYTGESYEFETRINAMNALKRLNLLDESVVKNMIQGLSHWNYKIRSAAADNLKYLYQQDKYKILIDRVAEKGLSEAAKTEFEKIRKAAR
ncbi:MAG: M1 family metallopeptidase [Bacteroidota bacterium]